ncbi:hypothetical protein [Mycetocola spongiae]|uniref:hypothetical protein n=1 Tax=Mycetocola spongiae TaxID=2859226 RepID=UPI001CF44C46|nr:hypothetical protein [Mycetocola spongiae]UCR89249.1 hypothetical protein KXZ72_00605 [Mycetocola spongiae]
MSYIWRGPEVTAHILAAGVGGVNKAAERLKAVSVPRAPKLDGVLRASAQVTPATAGDPTAVVSYDTPYAVKQHEELGYRHPGGGGAKYLEAPLHEHATELQAIIAKEIGGAL